MAEIVAKQSLDLFGKQPYASLKTEISAQTASVMIEVERQTSKNAVAWDEKTTLAVDLLVELDGEPFHCRGKATGGIRPGPGGEEAAVYRLIYSLPWGFFGGEVTKRLGELKATSFTLVCSLELVAGDELHSTVYISTEEAPAPALTKHNSVAFDAASSVRETGGDGIVSVNHTAAGSDRVAIIGVGTEINFGSAAGTVTYGGSSATNITTEDGLFAQAAAFYYIAPPASSQSVVSDLTETSPFEHLLGIVTVTGADQTTPTAGTQTQNGTSAASPASVTVPSVGTDDMVVDTFIIQGTSTPTIGADQTERVTKTSGAPDAFKMSTQPGTAGGVMSWTWSGSQHFAYIATRVIASTGGAATTRGTPFGHRGTAFNGGRALHGVIQ